MSQILVQQATSRKVAGTSPYEVNEYFFLIYLILPTAHWAWGLLSL
jgi:hypothetical protein